MPRAVMSMIQKLSGRELRNRIRELHISATSDVLSTMLDHFKDNEESEALNEPSPDIHCSTRSLRLLASYPSPLHAKPQLPETFSARQFPHLRYLQLAGCEFRLDSSIFLSSSLTHLSLRLNTTPYSLQLLTSVLTKHPQLTRLTIQFAAKTIIEADADLVNLPFLQEIKLSGQASACFALMARVSHGHLLKDTEITVGEIGRPSASIEPQILQFLERSYTDTGFTGATEAQPLTIRRLELQDGSMTKKIQFWDSPQKPYRYISTKPPPQHLCVTWTTYSPTLELQKLCTILPFDQLHTISLSGVIVGREAWVNLFGRMPSLVVLNFSGDGMAGPILAALRPSQKKKAESKKQKAKTKVKGYGPSSLKLRTHDVATTLLLPHLHQLVLEGVDFKEYNFYEGIGEEQALLQILQDALLERKAAGKGIHELTLLECRNISHEDVEDCKSAKIAEVIEWDEEENIDKNGYEENCLYQDSEYDEYPYPDYYCAWFFFGLLHLQL